MKIYTKTGDDGETGLFGGPRVRKDSPRIEAFGAVDELNALVGVARAESLPSEIDDLLARIQAELFDLGAQLATPDPAAHGTALIDAARIAALEAEIDRFEAGLKPLKQFILPGGTRGAAALHVARTVCRRAERRIVALSHTADHQVSAALVIYLNRLSDLLFVLARAANAAAGQVDVPWHARS
jgi:cob(I)alamin adenosyltransferase